MWMGICSMFRAKPWNPEDISPAADTDLPLVCCGHSVCRAGSECLGPGHPCSSENSPGRGAPDGLQEESSESLAFGFGEPHKAGSCSRTCSNRTSSVPGWQRHKYLWTLCILNGFENDSSQETAPQSHLQVLLLICIRMLSMNCHVTPAELMWFAPADYPKVHWPTA